MIDSRKIEFPGAIGGNLAARLDLPVRPRAYALFGRTLAPDALRLEPPARAHMELLIDRQGYIRARWIPGEGRPSWSDLDVLREQIQMLGREAPAPLPDEHVH